MTYSLDPGAPPGVAIDARSGMITWSPAVAAPRGLRPHGPRHRGRRPRPSGDPGRGRPPRRRDAAPEPRADPRPRGDRRPGRDADRRRHRPLPGRDAELQPRPRRRRVPRSTPGPAQFAWPIPASQAPGDYVITARATDDGIPTLSVARTFVVRVDRPTGPPAVGTATTPALTAARPLYAGKGRHRRLVGLELDFSAPLDPTSAGSVAALPGDDRVPEAPRRRSPGAGRGRPLRQGRRGRGAEPLPTPSPGQAGRHRLRAGRRRRRARSDRDCPALSGRSDLWSGPAGNLRFRNSPESEEDPHRYKAPSRRSDMPHDHRLVDLVRGSDNRQFGGRDSCRFISPEWRFGTDGTRPASPGGCGPRRRSVRRARLWPGRDRRRPIISEKAEASGASPDRGQRFPAGQRGDTDPAVGPLPEPGDIDMRQNRIQTVVRLLCGTLDVA